MIEAYSREGSVPMAAKKTRRSAFVPRLLVRTAVAGVVPACALACGGYGDGQSLGVANMAYPGDAQSDGVGAIGYGDARPDTGLLGVAAVAYPAYEAGPPDAGAKGEAGPADAAPDVFHGFVLAVTAYEVGGPTKT
jgi:hypothetical protein